MANSVRRIFETVPTLLRHISNHPGTYVQEIIRDPTVHYTYSSAKTIYSNLAKLEELGFLTSEQATIKGRQGLIRLFYITPEGEELLEAFKLMEGLWK